LTKVYVSLGTKQTLQQDAKSNAAQDDKQHNAAIRRRNHIKIKMKSWCLKSTYLNLIIEKRKWFYKQFNTHQNQFY